MPSPLRFTLATVLTTLLLAAGFRAHAQEPTATPTPTAAPSPTPTAPTPTATPTTAPTPTPTPTGPPPFQPVVTWYFAEGSTAPPFDTWFLVQNPTGDPARVRFTFQLEGGGASVAEFLVNPHSRFSLFANQVLPGRAFSTRVEADKQIYVERSMFVGFDGHNVPGIKAPNTRWLFAEGSTQSPFHTWLLLQNPNAEAATATVTYLVQGGSPATQVLLLPPLSRTSIFVNEVLPNVAFSIQVQGDRPLVAERAMYRFPGNAASAVSGANQPARTWYFAEGNTGARGLPTDTWLLLQNPNNAFVTVNVTLYRETGGPVVLTPTLPPLSRQSLFLNEFIQGSFGIKVEAPSDIVAERSIFIGTEPRGASTTVGSPELANNWFLAEGSTAPPFDTVIAFVNPGSGTATVNINFELETGSVVPFQLSVPPQAKRSLLVDDLFPFAALSARIEVNQPVVVERTMYISKLGRLGLHIKTGLR